MVSNERTLFIYLFHVAMILPIPLTSYIQIYCDPQFLGLLSDKGRPLKTPAFVKLYGDSIKLNSVYIRRIHKFPVTVTRGLKLHSWSFLQIQQSFSGFLFVLESRTGNIMLSLEGPYKNATTTARRTSKNKRFDENKTMTLRVRQKNYIVLDVLCKTGTWNDPIQRRTWAQNRDFFFFLFCT